MKKIIPVILFMILFTTCENIDTSKKPKATLEGFDIESISLKDITFLFDVGIENPYPVELKLSDVKLKVSLENKQLFKTNTKKGLNIKASGKAITTVKVNLKYEDIIKIAGDCKKKDYLNSVFDIEVIISTCVKKFSFKYQLKKKIPVFKPTIKITRFKVKKPKLDIFNLDVKLSVDYDIELKNETKSKLKFQKINYDFYINSSKLVDAESKKLKTVGNKSVMRVKNKFSSKALGKSILNAFKKGKGEYDLKGFVLVKFPDSIKKEPVKLHFDTKGNLKIK